MRSQPHWQHCTGYSVTHYPWRAFTSDPTPYFRLQRFRPRTSKSSPPPLCPAVQDHGSRAEWYRRRVTDARRGSGVGGTLRCGAATATGHIASVLSKHAVPLPSPPVGVGQGRRLSLPESVLREASAAGISYWSYWITHNVVIPDASQSPPWSLWRQNWGPVKLVVFMNREDAFKLGSIWIVGPYEHVGSLQLGSL